MGSRPAAGSLQKCPFNIGRRWRLCLFLAKANKPQQENKIFARSNGGRTWAPSEENSRSLWSGVGRLRGPKGGFMPTAVAEEAERRRNVK